MKKLLLLLILITAVSCNNNSKAVEVVEGTEVETTTATDPNDFEELKKELRILPVKNAVLEQEAFVRITQASFLVNTIIVFFDIREKYVAKTPVKPDQGCYLWCIVT